MLDEFDKRINGPFETKGRAKLKRKIEINGRFREISAESAAAAAVAMSARAGAMDSRLGDQLRRVPTSTVDLQMLGPSSRASSSTNLNEHAGGGGLRSRTSSFAGSGVKLCDLDQE